MNPKKKLHACIGVTWNANSATRLLSDTPSAAWCQGQYQNAANTEKTEVFDASNTPRKTNMSPENQWLEDVFPIEIVPF